MKSPFFIWRSGTLDGFDTVEELENCFPLDGPVDSDFIACDSEGRILRVGRAADGATVLTCDEGQSPSPGTLRTILRGYLERKGMSCEELDSLSLGDLVTRAYPPPDPRLEQMKYKFILHYIVVPVVVLLCFALYQLFTWLSAPPDHPLQIK